uniref:Uncharacterized protein n=1 Tax=Anguilla anguilla TaxID=7936 RepID=A0A0E9QRM5_ANGAN
MLECKHMSVMENCDCLSLLFWAVCFLCITGNILF